MASAAACDTDYTEYTGLLRFVLSTTELGGKNGLNDWINSNTKPQQHNPALWEKSGEHCIHATATQSGSGGGIPLHDRDGMKGPYVHALRALPAPYPSILRGRYAPKPTHLDKFEVVYPILKRYRTAASVLLAKEMIDHLYHPRNVIDAPGVAPRSEKIWERLGYTSAEWMDAAERKAWNRLNQRLDEHVGPAVMAWVAECRRRGLAI